MPQITDTLTQAVQDDASRLRISALGVNITDVSNSDAGDFRVSAIQGDAGLELVSAKSGDGSQLRVSAIVDNGSISAKSSGADTFLVSAKQGDAGILRISGIQGDGANLRISAIQDGAAALNISAKSQDGALLRTSAVQDGAASLNVSAKSDDAAKLRVSAILFPSTVGGLSVFKNLNLSSSVNVKSSAGAIYGWHAWSNAATQQYVKFYNVSGAINVGTDTPVMTIKLNISGISDVAHDTGLVGFTNGISLAALSGAPDDNTAVSPASAVGINLFYK